MRLYRVGWSVLVYFLSWVICTTESTNDWSPEFLAQTRKANCILGNIQSDVTFLHGTDSGNFKQLGKVADMNVCALLCCEMDTCDAAFMADRNCYAVECHSPEHCAIAPAHKNKWHPLVVFIKKLKSQNVKSTDTILNKGDKSKSSIKNLSDKSENSLQKHDVKSMNSNSNYNKPNIVNIQPSKLTDDGMKLAVMASDSSILGDENTELDQTKKAPTVITQQKHAKIPTTPLIQNVLGGVGSLTIPAVKSKIQTVQMAQTNKNPEMTENDQKSWRQRKLEESRHSLVSAAVVTCSMAFLLSFAALIAAKIRKHKESNKNPDYSTVPNVEDHD